jgi:hypothetical protein
MVFLGLEYASDGPELSNEEIDREFAELEVELLKELQSSLRQNGGVLALARRRSCFGLAISASVVSSALRESALAFCCI